MNNKKTKICSRKDCDLADIEQDISNFGFINKKLGKIFAECKKCHNKRMRQKRIDNKPSVVDIKTQVCSLKDCQYSGLEQDIGNFPFNKKKGKYHLECKICKKKHELSLKNKWYQENKVRIIANDIKYREDNKEELKLERAKKYQENKKEISEKNAISYQKHREDKLATGRKWYEENKEEVAKYKADWYQENKERVNAINAEYRENNKEKIAIKKAEYKKERLNTDPGFKFREAFSKLFRYYLKANNIHKDNSTFKILGYTSDEIREHIYSKFSDPDNLDNNGKVWMTPHNQGIYRKDKWDENDSSTWKWQIDHEKPQSDFNCQSLNDPNFKKCWSLDNLRPLKAKDNLLDGVKRTRHKTPRKNAKQKKEDT